MSVYVVNKIVKYVAKVWFLMSEILPTKQNNSFTFYFVKFKEHPTFNVPIVLLLKNI